LVQIIGIRHCSFQEHEELCLKNPENNPTIPTLSKHFLPLKHDFFILTSHTTIIKHV
jgi:hypothetical protein